LEKDCEFQDPILSRCNKMKPMLTQDDIFELTGAKRPAEQKRVLSNARIYFIERLNGTLAVTWHHVNNPMVATSTRTEPNINWEMI